MKVYALVGKSGTGKSFQAMNLCRQMNIETIIDDGLFISGSNVVAGISAKRQKTKIGAIKTALFTDEKHRENVRAAIAKAAPASILLLGTSDRMVEQIGQAIGVGAPEEIIHIEDITTEEERGIARRSRKELGKHVIPVATFQIKKDFSGYFMDTLKNLVGRGSKEVHGEKTVVRPTYSYLGDYEIAEDVVEDLVRYCARNISEVQHVGRVGVKETDTGVVITLNAVFKYGVSVPQAGRRLQQKIGSRVALMTAFNIDEVNINIKLAK